MNLKKTLKALCIAAFLLCSLSTFIQAKQITESDIIKAQKAWGDAVVKISQLPPSKQRKATSFMIEKLYAFDDQEVLFKPTSQNKVILKKKDAIDYFTPSNSAKIKAVKFINANFILLEKVAIAMGQYQFKPKGKKPVYLLDYTFVYTRNKNNTLKIITHHSSLPFQKPSLN